MSRVPSTALRHLALVAANDTSPETVQEQRASARRAFQAWEAARFQAGNFQEWPWPPSATRNAQGTAHAENCARASTTSGKMGRTLSPGHPG